MINDPESVTECKNKIDEKVEKVSDIITELNIEIETLKDFKTEYEKMIDDPESVPECKKKIDEKVKKISDKKDKMLKYGGIAGGVIILILSVILIIKLS